MRLWLLFVCIASPWISAKSDAKYETTTYNDETRREDHVSHQNNHPDNTTQNSTENVTVVKNETVTEKSTALRTIELSPTFEQTGGKEICSNAEFLIKILTVMLPLLRQDVPETTRTSAVLLILKELLQSSPEAARDHEVMYKINDLLQTLEKYHVNNTYENKNALRNSNNGLSGPQGVETKIAFKFEVPQFQNPNCTAELLMIIKVVQQAIMRLVNNPVCNGNVEHLGLPIIPNIDKQLLIDHDLYETNLYKYPSISEGYPKLDLNIPHKYWFPKDENSHKTNIENNPIHVIDKLPSQYPSYPHQSESLTYPQSQKIPHYPVYSYDASPSNSPLIKPKYDQGEPFYPSINNAETPDSHYISIYSTPKPYVEDYLPDHSGSLNYIPFEQSFNNPTLKFDSPSQYPLNPAALDESNINLDDEETPQNLFEFDVHASPSPFEIIGSDGSGYVSLDHKISPYDVYPGNSLDSDGIFNPTPSTLEIFGNPRESDIIIKQDPHKIPVLIDMNIEPTTHSPFEVIGSGSGDVEISNKNPYIYKEVDWLPLHPDDISSEFDLKHRYPNYEGHVTTFAPLPFETDDDSNLAHINEKQPYHGLHLNLPVQQPQLEVIGDEGSAEIQFGHDRPKHLYEFELPKRPKPKLLDVDGDGSSFVPVGQNQPYSGYEIDVLPNKPLEIIGDEGSAEIAIGQNRPTPFFDIDVPTKHIPAPFEVIDSDENVYIPIDPPRKPSSPKYDKSPESSPLIKGRPDFSPNEISPQHLYPSNAQNRPVKQYSPYFSEEYLPQEKLSPLSPFTVIGDGSGEISLEPSPHSTDISGNIPNHYQPQNPQNKLIYPNDNDNIYPNKPFDESFYPSIPGTNPKPPSDPYLDYFYPREDNPYPILPFVNLRPKNIDVSSQPSLQEKHTIVSDPITWHPPYYDVPDKTNIFPQSEEMSYEETGISKPVGLWDSVYPKYSTVDIPVPHLDKKIILIIKDNIDVIEQKIPKMDLNIAIIALIRNHISKIKELLSLEEITVEEYINLIHRYEILIEYIKHSDISGEILNDLLLSMTNGGELDLQPGKLKVIELTYLVKRPTPLIYQPYYYIKYRLPYKSFLSRMEYLLAENPQLSKYPAKLYKSLIPMSNVAEISPDLEGYGKEDIVKLTFSNGTLVGAKVMKEKDADMYASLNTLKEINADLTLEDVYQLIKKLDVQLKESNTNNLVYQSSDEAARQTITDNIESKLKSDALHDNNKFQKITVKNPLIANKVTNIITKKVNSDQLVANILNQINNLRSNANESNTLEKIEPFLKGVNIKENEVGNEKIRESNNLILKDVIIPIHELGSSDGDESMETINLNQDLKSNIQEGKTDISHGDVPKLSNNVYEDNSYKIDKIKSYHDIDTIVSNSQEKHDHNKLNLKPIKSDTSTYLETKLIDATQDAKKYNFIDTPMTKNNDFDSDHLTFDNSDINNNPIIVNTNSLSSSSLRQLDSSIGPKLLDATLKAHNYKNINNPQTSKFDFASLPLKTRSDSYINGNSNIISSQNKIKHSNSYIVDGMVTDAVLPDSNFIKHSQTYTSNNPEYFDSNAFKHTFKHPNIIKSDLIKNSRNNIGNHDFVNNYESYIDNQNNQIKHSEAYYKNVPNSVYSNFAKNSVNYIVPNQNAFQNNLLKRYQYQILHRTPYVYHQTYTYPTIYRMPIKRG